MVYPVICKMLNFCIDVLVDSWLEHVAPRIWQVLDQTILHQKQLSEFWPFIYPFIGFYNEIFLFKPRPNVL